MFTTYYFIESLHISIFCCLLLGWCFITRFKRFSEGFSRLVRGFSCFVIKRKKANLFQLQLKIDFCPSNYTYARLHLFLSFKAILYVFLWIKKNHTHSEEKLIITGLYTVLLYSSHIQSIVRVCMKVYIRKVHMMFFLLTYLFLLLTIFPSHVCRFCCNTILRCCCC